MIEWHWEKVCVNEIYIFFLGCNKTIYIQMGYKRFKALRWSLRRHKAFFLSIFEVLEDTTFFLTLLFEANSEEDKEIVFVVSARGFFFTIRFLNNERGFSFSVLFDDRVFVEIFISESDGILIDIAGDLVFFFCFSSEESRRRSPLNPAVSLLIE